MAPLLPPLPQSPKVSKEELEEQFRDLGKRLAYLLATADIPNDVKEALAILVPEMSLEQIDKLIKLLENSVVSGTAKELEDFKNSVIEINAKHKEQLSQSESKALGQLDDLEKQLDQI